MHTISSAFRSMRTVGVAFTFAAGVTLTGVASPAMAASGHWNLTETHTWQWGDYPSRIVEPLSYDSATWRIRGSYTGDQLTSATVTEGGGCTRQYAWTLPPASAADGQAFAVTSTAGGTCGPKYWFWDIGFDLANTEPGVTTGWNYPGRVFAFNEDTGGTQAGSVTFPTGDSTAVDASGAKKIRLQVKAERWAVQYVYTWTADPVGDGGAGGEIIVDEGEDDVVAPGAPTGVSVKALSSRKARVSWAAPSTGSPATGYTVKARGARPGKKWTKWQTGTTAGTVIVVKLKKPGSKLQVYVIASNQAGNGPASTWVTKKLPKR